MTRRAAAPLLRRDDACGRPADRLRRDRPRARAGSRDADRLGARAARRLEDVERAAGEPVELERGDARFVLARRRAGRRPLPEHAPVVADEPGSSRSSPSCRPRRRRAATGCPSSCRRMPRRCTACGSALLLGARALRALLVPLLRRARRRAARGARHGAGRRRRAEGDRDRRRRAPPARARRPLCAACRPTSRSCAPGIRRVTDEELERIAGFVDVVLRLGARGAHRDAGGRAAGAAVRVRARRRAPARPPRRPLARGRPRARRSTTRRTRSPRARPRRSSRPTTACSGSSTRSRASAPAPRRSRSSTTSSSGPTRSSRRRSSGASCRARDASCRRRSRRINAGEFVPTPSEFTCSGCPALDLVCAGPRLGGGAWPPAAPVARQCLMARSYIREARRSASRRRRQRIRPVIERLAVEHADAKIALCVREPARAARLGDALGADDRRERQPRHGEALRQVPPPRGLPRRAAGGARAATSSRPASTARRRSRCAG